MTGASGLRLPTDDKNHLHFSSDILLSAMPAVYVNLLKPRPEMEDLTPSSLFCLLREDN